MSKEDWWIDFVEGEMGAELKDDMLHLLKKSNKDREMAASILRIRAWLKQADPADRWWREDKMTQLTRRILNEVEHKVTDSHEQKSSGPTPGVSPRKGFLEKRARL